MSQNPDHSPHVRRVVLPSGRAIEVVYFEGHPVDPRPPVVAAAPGVERDLEACPGCAASLVYPIDWEEIRPMEWEVELRCPNCEWYEIGTFPQDVVDRFDDELDRGMDALVRDLRRLTRANMEDDLARLTLALGADAIWPMDF